MNTPKKTAINNRRTTMPKIKRADELRRKSVSDGIILENTIKSWDKRIKTAKNESKRKKLNDIYGNKTEELFEANSKSYKKYYDYVDKNFKKENVKSAMAASKNFSSKRFINSLAKTEKK